MLIDAKQAEKAFQVTGKWIIFMFSCLQSKLILYKYGLIFLLAPI